MWYPIVMTTYERGKTLRRSLGSLAKTNIPKDVPILIFDDKSQNKYVKEIIDTFQAAKGQQVTWRSRSNRKGPEGNMLHGIKEAFDTFDAEFVILLNDDMLYSMDWYTTLCDTIDEYNATAGVVSCFNTRAHPFRYMVSDTVGVKRWLGGCCTAYRRRVISELYKHGIPAMFDAACCNASRTCEYLRYCTKLSYVDHIGSVGVNSTEARHDRAIDFVGEVS